jgi:tRNA A37 threonylcarbamoyladenosine dehydratase
MDTVTKYIEKHQHGVQLTLTAVAASALTASAVFGYQAMARKSKRDFKRSNSIQANNILIVKEEEQDESREKMDESLVKELLSRNIAFFGDDKVDKIRRSFVVVVGVGAIGSWTALMLVRSGVEHVRLIDPGFIKTSTLSRNAVAKVVDIGKTKVATMKKYLAGIAPNAVVETEVESLCQENTNALLSGNVDFVVDTVSNVKDKVLLAKYCKENNIRLVSSISAGGKGDPTQIQVTDINQTMGKK